MEKEDRKVQAQKLIEENIFLLSSNQLSEFKSKSKEDLMAFLHPERSSKILQNENGYKELFSTLLLNSIKIHSLFLKIHQNSPNNENSNFSLPQKDSRENKGQILSKSQANSKTSNVLNQVIPPKIRRIEALDQGENSSIFADSTTETQKLRNPFKNPKNLISMPEGIIFEKPSSDKRTQFLARGRLYPEDDDYLLFWSVEKKISKYERKKINLREKINTNSARDIESKQEKIEILNHIYSSILEYFLINAVVGERWLIFRFTSEEGLQILLDRSLPGKAQIEIQIYEFSRGNKEDEDTGRLMIFINNNLFSSINITRKLKKPQKLAKLLKASTNVLALQNALDKKRGNSKVEFLRNITLISEDVATKKGKKRITSNGKTYYGLVLSKKGNFRIMKATKLGQDEDFNTDKIKKIRPSSIRYQDCHGGSADITSLSSLVSQEEDWNPVNKKSPFVLCDLGFGCSHFLIGSLHEDGRFFVCGIEIEGRVSQERKKTEFHLKIFNPTWLNFWMSSFDLADISVHFHSNNMILIANSNVSNLSKLLSWKMRISKTEGLSFKPHRMIFPTMPSKFFEIILIGRISSIYTDEKKNTHLTRKLNKYEMRMVSNDSYSQNLIFAQVNPKLQELDFFYGIDLDLVTQNLTRKREWKFGPIDIKDLLKKKMKIEEEKNGSQDMKSN